MAHQAQQKEDLSNRKLRLLLGYRLNGQEKTVHVDLIHDRLHQPADYSIFRQWVDPAVEIDEILNISFVRI